MPNRLPIKTLRARLILWFVVIAAVPMVLLGLLLYRQQAEATRAEAFAKLTAVRDLKILRLNAWLEEMQSDFATLTADTQTLLNSGGQAALDAAVLTRLRTQLDNYVRSHSDLTDLTLIDAATGRVLAATTRQVEGEDRSATASFKETLRTKKFCLNDVHFSTVTQRRRMTLSNPVLTPGAASVTAVLVGDINLAAFDKLLQDRTGMGETGETLLVNRDLLALNELRWRDNAPLRLKIGATTPAGLAALGGNGIVEADDYRGVPVLAAYAYLPATGWGFVAKQDLVEIHAPAASFLRTLTLLALACLAVAAGLATLLAGNLVRPLTRLQATAEAIRAGQFTARNPTDRTDELGNLARSFNDMADRVQSQMTVQQGNRALMEALTGAASLPAFCTALLQTLMRVTGSDLGAVLMPGADGRFAATAAQGLSAAALEPFDAARLEGALGAALTSRQVSHLRDLPAETRFTFRTVAGTAVPRALLTIPMVVGERIEAVIALGSLRDYPPEALAVVETSLTALQVGLANLLAGEQTRRLAEELALKNTELTAQTGELEAQTAELQQQSQTLKDQNTELEVQTARVAQANRLKSEFLSNMSHELRTPLNSVLALARVLQMQSQSRLTPEEINYVEIIERNGKHLLSLINDILDLAKIEAGRVEVATEEFSLTEKLTTLAENLMPICREKGIALNVQIEPNLPHLRSDERRVHHVLQNVLGNAVKFTQAGHVTLTARCRSDAVEVTVADTGIGIPERELPHIFEEFRQADGSTARSFEGTGLGLAIAAKSVALLGGHIAVQSQVGVGSTFTITLPLDTRSAAVAGQTPAAPSGIAAPHAPDGPRRTVLVVDDTPEDARLITNYLAGEGYDTLTAHSGQEALRLAATHALFAITLDVIMPDMDGWEVLQALKQNPATAATPVLIVSLSEDRATGLALGAFGVVAKPVDRAVLLKEIRRVTPAGRASIIVADDADLDRALMTDMLEFEGLEVRPARNGAECLALVAERLPDVVALDLMMPGMSGFEVLDALRSSARTRSLPVVIVTAAELSPAENQRLRGRVASVVEKSRLAAGDLLAEIGRILAQLGRTPALPDAPRSSLPAVSRLLLVEDSEPAIVQIKLVLETAGYTVDVARGGQEALELMQQRPPDGIILDLMMPQIDGFAVLEQLRGTPATAHTPVLILTAKDLTPQDLSRLSANHVQQLIQKGDVDRMGLLREVERLLRRPAPARVPAAASDRPAGARKRVPAGRLPTILALEDNADNRATLRAILNGRCQLREAVDGEAGLKAALQQPPDLILLDLSLPKLDGFSVIRQLRAAPATRDVPVIALTAHAMPGDREQALAAGCDDYLPKPIDVERLLAAVSRWTGGGGQ